MSESEPLLLDALASREKMSQPLATQEEINLTSSLIKQAEPQSKAREIKNARKIVDETKCSQNESEKRSRVGRARWCGFLKRRS